MHFRKSMSMNIETGKHITLAIDVLVYASLKIFLASPVSKCKIGIQSGPPCAHCKAYPHQLWGYQYLVDRLHNQLMFTP